MLVMPWANTDRIVCADTYFASVPAAEELWNHGIRFIGVIKTAMWQFPMEYLYNIEFHNWGDMSGLLTSPVDRTKPVLGAFFYGLEQAVLLFYWGIDWRKGSRTLACDVGKRNLTQIQSPIWLS